MARIYTLCLFWLFVATSALAQGLSSEDKAMIQKSNRQVRDLLQDTTVQTGQSIQKITPKQTQQMLERASQHLNATANRVPTDISPPNISNNIQDIADHYEQLKKAVKGDQPGFLAEGYIVFISESMKPESLKLLAQQSTGRKDTKLVLRGMVENSTKKTVSFITQNDLQGAEIDPRLYKTFNIESVPTFVYFNQDEWVGLSGDVSLDFAIAKLMQAKDQMSEISPPN